VSDSVKIKFWGVRGSTPCANSENMVYGGNTTCFQITSTELQELLIIDCGTGLRNLGNHLIYHGEPLKGRVFVTHPHWDHLQGFPFFKPFYEDDSWFRVYLPPQEDLTCKEILQGHMSNTFFPVTIDMLNADMDCETFEPGVMSFEGYSVDYMWAKHTINTAMFRFKIGGKTIVVAPDNELPLDGAPNAEAFINEFQSFIQGADVLVHDAQYNHEQMKHRVGWGHSSWERVIELTKGCGVKKLILTHHDPDSSDEYLAALDNHVKEEFANDFELICFAKEDFEIS
jgi:phosphoribosyl 1,2-cyclic phosphodiesterase